MKSVAGGEALKKNWYGSVEREVLRTPVEKVSSPKKEYRSREIAAHQKIMGVIN